MKAVNLLSLMFIFIVANAQYHGYIWHKELFYSEVYDFHDGIARIVDEGKFGYINTEADLIIPNIYYNGYDFSEGKAAVKNEEGLWGFLNAAGDTVIDFKYQNVTPFSDGVSIAQYNKTHVYLFEDGTMRQIAGNKELYPYCDELARFKRGEKWGYLDKKGKVAIRPKYDIAYDFSSGVAWVKKGDHGKHITTKGRRLETIAHNSSRLNFVDGYAKSQRLNLYGYTSKTGWRITEKYIDAKDFSEGLAAVKVMDKWGYVNTGGVSIIDFKYDESGSFTNGHAAVKSDGVVGLIDGTGKYVIDPVFDEIGVVGAGAVIATINGRKGIVKLTDSPNQEIKLSIPHLEFNDEDNNKIVNAEENFSISFIVKNTCEYKMDSISVSILKKGDISNYLTKNEEEINLKRSLEPDEEMEMFYTFNSLRSLPNGVANFEVEVLSDRLLFPVKKEIVIPCGEYQSPNLTLAGYSLKNKDNAYGQLLVGDTAILDMNIMNIGEGIARNVEAKIHYPHNFKSEELVFTLGRMFPGNIQSIQTQFVLKEDIDSTEILDLRIELSESKHIYGDMDKISFQAGTYSIYKNLLAEGEIAIPTAISTQEASRINEIAKQGTEEEDIFVSELLEDIPMNAPKGNRLALIIGNEDYNSAKSNATYQVGVEFALNDAETFAVYAERVLGIEKANIVLEKNATLAQMNSVIRKITSLTRENPYYYELYVYYAGHGQCDNLSKDTYLIPVDVSLTSPTEGYPLNKLYSQLSEAKTNRTFVFMDACYSGVGRGIVVKPNESIIRGNTIVFTSSSATEKSMPLKEKRHGLFTYELLKKMKDSKGQMEISQLYTLTRDEVKRKSILIQGAKQSPELLSGSDIEDGWRAWKLYN